MQRKRTGVYNALVMIPDRVYPFRTRIHGQWVRGIRSYDAALSRYQRAYGIGHYGYRLDAYRQLFHLAGSILFLVAAAYVSQSVLGSPDSLYAFLAVAVAFISFQEFYLHRRLYQQLWKKSFVDWLAWCVPIGIYFLAHVR